MMFVILHIILSYHWNRVTIVFSEYCQNTYYYNMDYTCKIINNKVSSLSGFFTQYFI